MQVDGMQIDDGNRRSITSPRINLPHPNGVVVDSPRIDIHSPLHTAIKPMVFLSTSAPSSPTNIGYPSPLQIAASNHGSSNYLMSPVGKGLASFTHTQLTASTVVATSHTHTHPRTLSPTNRKPPHHPGNIVAAPVVTVLHSSVHLQSVANGYHNSIAMNGASPVQSSLTAPHTNGHVPPSSPITSASPHARRIKSHFAAQGRDVNHNNYALPPSIEPMNLTASSSSSPAMLNGHSASPSKSPSDPAAVFPIPPLALPTPAMKHVDGVIGANGTSSHAHSHLPTQSEEQEAILFSPAYVLPPADTNAPSSSSSQHHPIVAVNSIPETVLAQSTVVQSAVATAATSQGGGVNKTVSASTAALTRKESAAAAAQAATAVAVAANALSEEEFDPFLFIKNLPPLSQAIRTCTVPVLPPLVLNPGMAPPLSLALDLDETLCHCSIEPMKKYDLTFQVLFNGQEYQVYVALRPHLFKFLAEVAETGFEVIIFTASQKIYADKLLGILDPINSSGKGKYFHHRIFRDSCVCVEGNYLKDLSVLGRDLRTTVIVDNSVQAFGYQLDNGIPIESWFDDEKDDELLKLLPFLKHLKGMKDVRPILKQTFKLSEFVHNL